MRALAICPQQCATSESAREGGNLRWRMQRLAALTDCTLCRAHPETDQSEAGHKPGPKPHRTNDSSWDARPKEPSERCLQPRGREATYYRPVHNGAVRRRHSKTTSFGGHAAAKRQVANARIVGLHIANELLPTLAEINMPRGSAPRSPLGIVCVTTKRKPFPICHVLPSSHVLDMPRSARPQSCA